MTIRAFLRWLFSVVATLAIVPFLQAPASKLAETTRFDLYFSDRWEPLVAWLSSLSHNLWYVFFAGVIIGAAAGLWLALLFPEKRKYDTGIRLSISNLIGLPSKERPTLLGIVVEVEIWNTGMETEATEWSLRIRHNDGSYESGMISEIKNTIIVTGAIDTAIKTTESLVKLIKGKKVGRERTSGYLLFYTKIEEERQLKNSETVIEVTVQDDFGKSFSASKRIGDFLLGGY